jgi:putative redox protein
MGQVNIEYLGDLRTRCLHNESGDALLTDAPKASLGKGEKFSPTDLMAAALGSCVLTVMGVLAEKLKLDFTGVTAEVVKEMASLPARRIGQLKVQIRCPRKFDSQITERLERAATSCPVHHSLHPDIIQEFTFQWGEP